MDSWNTGNNLFFVRNDLVGTLPVLSPKEAYKQSRFRECHNEQGQLTFEDFNQRNKIISNMPLYDLDTNSTTTVGELVISNNTILQDN